MIEQERAKQLLQRFRALDRCPEDLGDHVRVFCELATDEAHAGEICELIIDTFDRCPPPARLRRVFEEYAQRRYTPEFALTAPPEPMLFDRPPYACQHCSGRMCKECRNTGFNLRDEAFLDQGICALCYGKKTSFFDSNFGEPCRGCHGEGWIPLGKKAAPRTHSFHRAGDVLQNLLGTHRSKFPRTDEGLRQAIDAIIQNYPDSYRRDHIDTTVCARCYNQGLERSWLRRDRVGSRWREARIGSDEYQRLRRQYGDMDGTTRVYETTRPCGCSKGKQYRTMYKANAPEANAQAKPVHSEQVYPDHKKAAGGDE